MAKRPATPRALRRRAIRRLLAAAGAYQQHSGSVIGVRQMAGPHVVNALLRALREDAPAEVVRTLAAEVKRRGLEKLAMDIAAATEGRTDGHG
jgi:hypothetical protein